MKLLRGSKVDRPDEPMPPKSELEMPHGLSEQGQKAWPDIRRQLEALNVSTVADEKTVVELCEAMAEVNSLRMAVRRTGRTTMTKNGVAIHPNVQMLERSRKHLLDLLRDFGMTPSSRARVREIKKTAQNPFTAIKGKTA